MRRILFGFAALGALASSGCMYSYAVPAVQGRAYVVRNEFAGSTFWNCDATSGEPVCYQVTKQVMAAGAAK